jgi:hypothetical protein
MTWQDRLRDAIPKGLRAAVRAMRDRVKPRS